MNPTRPVSRTRNRLVLLLIIGIFVGPIVLAWLFSSGRLALPGEELTHRGQLLDPPLDLSAEGARPGISPLFRLQPSEWAVVLLQTGTCAEQPCGKTLDDLLTLRELIGQGGVRVSTHAITGLPGAPERHATRVHPDAESLAFLAARLPSSGDSGPLPAIVLVDWRHQLMMRYAASGELSNIQRDLKRLLRASAIK